MKPDYGIPSSREIEFMNIQQRETNQLINDARKPILFKLTALTRKLILMHELEDKGYNIGPTIIHVRDNVEKLLAATKDADTISEKSIILAAVDNLIGIGYNGLRKYRHELLLSMRAASDLILKLDEYKKLILRLEQVNLLLQKNKDDRKLRMLRDSILEKMRLIEEEVFRLAKSKKIQMNEPKYTGSTYEVARCAENMLNILKGNPNIISVEIRDADEIRELIHLLYTNDDFQAMRNEIFKHIRDMQLPEAQAIRMLASVVYQLISSSSCSLNNADVLQIITDYIEEQG